VYSANECVPKSINFKFFLHDVQIALRKLFYCSLKAEDLTQGEQGFVFLI
jgi:hypothetical protein